MLRRHSKSTLAQSIGAALAGAAVSAATTYFLDARSGARRRALVRDQFHHLGRLTREFAGKADRDARQRGRGLYEEAITHLRNHEVNDAVVEARARARLGRLTTHPGAIDIRCSDGMLTLSGHVLTSEVASVLQGLSSVIGVRSIANHLNVHDQPGNIPALQGRRHDALPARFEFLQDNWAPAPRAAAGATGGAAIALGLASRHPLGWLGALGGAALLARSVFNRPLSKFIGLGARVRDGVDIQKTIEVFADPKEAYACWRDLENLPRFMTHVREIRKLDETRYQWSVDAIAGLSAEWTSRVTRDVPGELIAWTTDDEATVQSAGVIRFEPSAYGGTRVHVRMTYRPPANTVGHAVAKLFGRDARHQMSDDLLRFKAYVEGRASPVSGIAPQAADDSATAAMH